MGVAGGMKRRERNACLWLGSLKKIEILLKMGDNIKKNLNLRVSWCGIDLYG